MPLGTTANSLHHPAGRMSHPRPPARPAGLHQLTATAGVAAAPSKLLTAPLTPATLLHPDRGGIAAGLPERQSERYQHQGDSQQGPNRPDARLRAAARGSRSPDLRFSFPGVVRFTVVDKGNKERPTAFSPSVRDYLKQFPAIHRIDDEPLFQRRAMNRALHRYSSTGRLSESFDEGVQVFGRHHG